MPVFPQYTNKDENENKENHDDYEKGQPSKVKIAFPENLSQTQQDAIDKLDDGRF